MEVFAGQELYAALKVEKEQKVPRSLRPGCEDCFQSAPLIRFESELSNRGIRGASVVESIHGWYVRYDSGLQNFGILESANGTGGTFEAAKAWAINWVAQDPAKRYAFVK